MLYSVFVHYYNNVVIHLVCADFCAFIFHFCTFVRCVQEPTVTKPKVKPSVAKKGKDNRKMMAKLLNRFSY